MPLQDNPNYISPNTLNWGSFVSDMVEEYNPQAATISDPPAPVEMEYIFSVYIPVILK